MASTSMKLADLVSWGLTSRSTESLNRPASDSEDRCTDPSTGLGVCVCGFGSLQNIEERKGNRILKLSGTKPLPRWVKEAQPKLP